VRKLRSRSTCLVRWPGCYGHITVDSASSTCPDFPVFVRGRNRNRYRSGKFHIPPIQCRAVRDTFNCVARFHACRFRSQSRSRRRYCANRLASPHFLLHSGSGSESESVSFGKIPYSSDSMPCSTGHIQPHGQIQCLTFSIPMPIPTPTPRNMPP